MAYGHAERNLALIRQLEAETRQLCGSLPQLDQEQSAWLEELDREQSAWLEELDQEQSAWLEELDQDSQLADAPGAQQHVQDDAPAA
jgi:hypothetical protein